MVERPWPPVLFNAGLVRTSKSSNPARQAPGITGVSWPPVVPRSPGPTPLAGLPTKLRLPVEPGLPTEPRVLRLKLLMLQIRTAEIRTGQTSSRGSSGPRALPPKPRRRPLAGTALLPHMLWRARQLPGRSRRPAGAQPAVRTRRQRSPRVQQVPQPRMTTTLIPFRPRRFPDECWRWPW